MQRTSNSVGALASALAKAQLEIENPEKSLTATILSPFPREGSRTFRYAPLSSGLDLVRKCLGKHEIATVQTTAIDAESGLIRLTTTLVHASGEWVSSDWPVCPVGETAAPHRLGAALTYARRYALFTLVGIAGEDDLDAPDIPQRDLSSPDRTPPRRGGNGIARTPPRPDGKGSSSLRDRLLREIAETGDEEALAIWAKGAMPQKNQLNEDDARAVEAAYLAKVTATEASNSPHPLVGETHGDHAQRDPAASTQVTPRTKPIRRRNKAHLALVASQPCLLCQKGPCDAHHLKMAQPRSLGRKVSDQFTVPLCRRHHRELHRHGNERAWWQNQGIDPLPAAADLWERTQSLAHDPGGPSPMSAGTEKPESNGSLAAARNDETNPILRPETQ